MLDLTSPHLEHITIDWNKIHSVEDIKVVMQGFFGDLGMYTTDPAVKVFAKDSNEQY